MKKLLVFGVIVLFLGLAIAPSINANVSKASIDSELVEITTEICGLNGGKHTVQLSKEEAEEVEQLIDNIERRLDNVETREEAVEIFNEAIVELDKYGLLGGLSVKQAQRLVTGRYQNPGVIKHVNKKEGIFENANFFCLVAGSTSVTMIMTPRAVLLYILSRMSNLDVNITSLLSNLFFNSLEVSTFFNPILFLDIVYLGGIKYRQPLPKLVPAEGWIYSFGLMGEKSWNGSFYGNLPLPPLSIQLTHWDVYPGIFGLTGIKLSGFLLPTERFFLGSALWIKISQEHP